MPEFVENIVSLAASQNYEGMIDFYNKNIPESTDLIFAVYRLLGEGNDQAAYLLSRPLTQAQFRHPVISFVRSLGGFLYGNAEDEKQGLVALAQEIDLLTPPQREQIYQHIVHPAISRIITRDSSFASDSQKALRILEILKAGFPQFRSIFDWSDNGLTYDAVEQTKLGRQRSRLIQFALPETPRKNLRAIVAVRKLVFPQLPNSRLHEVGPRVTTAMNNYGWRATHLEMQMQNYFQDYSDIVSMCEQEKADILVLDDLYITSLQSLPARAAMIARLRQTLPNLKIAALHLDPWDIATEVLIETSRTVDAVWAQYPSMPVWEHPALSNKITFVPCPHAGQSGVPVTPLSPRMAFVGGIFGYNWHRIFWLAGREYNLPIDFIRSMHQSDGLSVVDSYILFMKRTEKVGVSLNFSMRPNLARIVTGRSFETILAGALLVQEETPDLDYYFVSGEHYLSFTTVPELRAIGKFLTEKPADAEAIRREGNAFARARYSDEKLIGYLEYDLLHRH
ncbi:MAG TPA: glycosyltransferase [Magnetospirillaceae bacterium]|jgi:hypothetical protein